MSSKIDQNLYSRQIYVLGNQAMLKLTEAKILLHGLGSLGVEIAKNLVLAGVGSLTIMDSKTSDIYDLGNQFFITPKHVQTKENRAHACLEKLRELNPYVRIDCLGGSEAEFKGQNDLESFLKNFNCVILTELRDLDVLLNVNSLCRKNRIHFLLSDVYGLFGFSFTDFGADYETIDTDGEEYRDMFISKISSEDEACVEVLDQHAHNLEVDDLIRLTEIESPNELNNQVHQVVAIINSFKFKINANTTTRPYSRGGIFRKIKKKQTLQFEPLDAQLERPEIILADLSPAKFLNPYLIHILVDTHLKNNQQQQQQQPNINKFLDSVKIEFEKFKEKNPNVDLSQLDNDLMRLARIFFLTNRCKLPPLASIYGGLCAQEALKSITSKFIPIKQWFYLDFSELFEVKDVESIDFTSFCQQLNKHDRYDNLRGCFGGEKTLQKLFDTRLFMVGCGAIGCEMLKNYALLGISCGRTNEDQKGKHSGLITITDHDLIEKSNLNRQFLFRQTDINMAKSKVAASACRRINPDMSVVAHEFKVCAQSEKDVFNDEFFGEQDLCVNALDNVEARRYMDSRCVTNQKALLESGTLGSKGHVQVILPHLTESYGSQKDPNDADADIPYCTLKSFPSMIEHCIQWSRDKFESSFKIKPSLIEKFLAKHFAQIDTLVAQLKQTSQDDGYVVEDAHKCAKMLNNNFCFTIDDCLRLARNKFEKYFAHKAMDILNAYPLDHLMSDNSPFWKLPKRAPTPIRFECEDKMHLAFCTSLARLLAELYAVDGWEAKLADEEFVKSVLKSNESNVPVWRPRKKHIETDETKKKGIQWAWVE